MDFSKELDKPVCYDPDDRTRMVTLREVMTWPEEKKQRVEGLPKAAAVKRPWEHPYEDKINEVSQSYPGGAVRIKGSCDHFIRQIRCAEKLPVVTMEFPCRKCMEEAKSAAVKPPKSITPTMLAPKKRVALREGQFAEVDPGEVDFELPSANAFLGSHANLIPLQSSVAGARVFYGARFANQAVPLTKAEAPLVQNLVDDDADGRSFDELLGNEAGAVRSKVTGRVLKVTPDAIEIEDEKGEKHIQDLYNAFPFNRKTAITSIPRVKAGDTITPGHLLARSNYTDDNGTLAMGVNARIGLVPYLGKTMDDAIVVSESFAKRMTSEHLFGHDLDYKKGVKGGKGHFISLFPQKFVNKQIEKLDDDGVIQVGQTVEPGDPIALATKPRIISSTSAQLGLLSKHMKNARTDASLKWEGSAPGIVTDVKKLRSGVKVNISTQLPTQEGDKIVLRPGAKGVISEIIPDDHMPRTVDGNPLEVLLNPLSLPSRVNNSTIYELLLGKVAKKRGQSLKFPAFNKATEKWYDMVQAELDKDGLTDKEEVFDPKLNRKLENPITVGNAYVLKLHHTSESKMSARGQGGYDSNEQPRHGGDELAGAKRMSGLETHGLLSAGAYNLIREGATLRGQRNDDYWRKLRMGVDPVEPGAPFVWDKFKALLVGSGYLSRSLPKGTERLTFFTDKDLDERKPVEVRTGDIVDLATMEPVKGGLFDASLTGNNAWGKISLPFRMVNPAASEMIRKMLGLTEKQYRAIMAGEMELPSHLQLQRNSL